MASQRIGVVGLGVRGGMQRLLLRWGLEGGGETVACVGGASLLLVNLFNPLPPSPLRAPAPPSTIPHTLALNSNHSHT